MYFKKYDYFITKNDDEDFWYDLLDRTNLTEEFIRKYIHKFLMMEYIEGLATMNDIVANQIVSDSFIEEFKHDISWSDVEVCFCYFTAFEVIKRDRQQPGYFNYIDHLYTNYINNK